MNKNYENLFNELLGNEVCPNCGCNPQDEPYCIEPTHCPECGYVFGMPIDEELSENECDCYQIGGICTEKNCKNCINHSGFYPVDIDERN